MNTEAPASPEQAVLPGRDITAEDFKTAVELHLKRSLARHAGSATQRDWWMATSMAVQDLVVERFIETMEVHNRENTRRIYYLSMEFLMGRLLRNNLYSAGVHDQATEALRQLGLDPEAIINEEYDMALGNGGLGRLAACFLDSLATLDLPAVGYGIRYEFGMFRQEFQNGHQVEHPESWVQYGDVWDIVRPEYTMRVQLYGEIENVFDDRGRPRPRWVNTREVLGVPFDIPICGYATNTVNFLRLWESRADEELNFDLFNQGGYIEAVREKIENETISKVLYPNDHSESGRELRLCQQYFFVCCSLQDIIRRYKKFNHDWDGFPEKAVIQLNDTHPAIAVAELMRIFHDEEDLPWEKAWDLVTRTFCYTNHTLLPEALETWPSHLLGKVLPRHLQIIYEINSRFLKEVEKKWPGDHGKKSALSLIDDHGVQRVRMAHLAVVGSHSVNGVAALHTQLLKKNLFPLFNEFYPGKFNNKTNGITPRRWLLASNRGLSDLITSKIGENWAKNLTRLRELEAYADDEGFQDAFMAVKHANKEKLVRIIEKDCGITVDPHAIFDVQIKRLHEYKRQHLNLLHILSLYKRLLNDPNLDIHPRVFIFGAKAAPGYELAKTIIKAINSVADMINNDARINGRLKVVFLPNYRVSLASYIIAASDVSEQISTAGKEASGTGNMKLALNGALTIGTLDGANVEIKEEVGDENIFIFGMTVDEVEALWEKGYNPWDFYNQNTMLRTVVDWVGSNFFTPEEPGVLAPLRHSLLDGGDPFMVLADFEAYCKAQEEVDRAYKDPRRWARMAILNTARMDKFSSDRTITEYAQDIWKLNPVRVEL